MIAALGPMLAAAAAAPAPAGEAGESGYPKRMEVDGVRVWQSDAKGASSEREAGGGKD